MSLVFDAVAAPSTLFRVGRKPDVWQWIDWRFAGPDGTFGCRWDDVGIFYLSRYGDDVVNCGVFERSDGFPITSLERSEIEQDDADFLHACELLGIEVR